MARFDVAIVGGGVIGLSIARELCRAGVEDVAVLERDASTGRGSSSRANGGVRAQFTTATNISFSLHSLTEIERLANDHADVLGWHQNGYLLLTGDEQRAQELVAALALQRSLGVETDELAKEDVARLAPIVRAEGLVAATFHARDGWLDPHGLVTAFDREARAAGARILTAHEVTSIEWDGGGFGITAANEHHHAAWVVNAAGPHARGVAALAAVDLPVHPVRRNLAYTRNATGLDIASMPMCVDLDTGVLVRGEGSDGLVIAYSDPADACGWDTSVDERFLPAVAARIGNRFPLLEGHPIHPRHCWAGLYPETPDGHAIVGAPRSMPRFVQCAGFGGHGLMHSPAAGVAVAELVTLGECRSFDLHALRLERFADGDVAREGAVF